MPQGLTYSKLALILKKVGFKRKVIQGSHVLYTYEKSDSDVIVTLPIIRGDAKVKRQHLTSIGRDLDMNGIVPKTQWEKLISEEELGEKKPPRVRVKVGDVVETKGGLVFRVHAIYNDAGGPFCAFGPVADIAHVLVRRRRVLGYVVREGITKGEGRYWDSEAAVSDEWAPSLAHVSAESFRRAKHDRNILRSRGIPCRIITIVAKTPGLSD